MGPAQPHRAPGLALDALKEAAATCGRRDGFFRTETLLAEYSLHGSSKGVPLPALDAVAGMKCLDLPGGRVFWTEQSAARQQRAEQDFIRILPEQLPVPTLQPTERLPVARDGPGANGADRSGQPGQRAQGQDDEQQGQGRRGNPGAEYRTSEAGNCSRSRMNRHRTEFTFQGRLR